MSEALNRAREYEQREEANILPGTRPAFHLSPRVGWLNDPNGFSWYRGSYHLFYQYHPYGPQWGPMHWGHAVSKDLIRWEYLPAALAPDEPYDEGGCFSGTAADLPDGRQLLMYTSVVWEPDDPGHRGIQTQSLAAGDGLNYTKYKNNPVITGEDLPKGGDPFEFRDPKLWQEPDGTWRALISNRNEEDGAQLLLFASEDGENWSFRKVLVRNRKRLGLMWECPDFFPLDGRQILLASAMDMLPRGLDYHSGNNSFCMIGDYDRTSETFREERIHTLDYGIDFYAAQTLEAPDGRRIMIGWMQNPDTTSMRTIKHPVFGQMTIPRELEIRGGRLQQRPVRELERYRRDEVSYKDVLLGADEMHLEGVGGRLVDLEFTIRIEPRSENWFSCRFAKDDEFYTELRYWPGSSVIRLDRKYSGQRRAVIRHRDAEVSSKDGCLKVRLLLDRYSAEVFLNDGEKVMTITLETRLTAEEIVFTASGKAVLDVTSYRLDMNDPDNVSKEYNDQ